MTPPAAIGPPRFENSAPSLRGRQVLAFEEVVRVLVGGDTVKEQEAPSEEVQARRPSPP
jgi:hypothetical protein